MAQLMMSFNQKIFPYNMRFNSSWLLSSLSTELTALSMPTKRPAVIV
jgi:hypothetical protein